MKNLKSLILAGVLLVAFVAFAVAQNTPTQNRPNGNVLDYCPWQTGNTNMGTAGMMHSGMVGQRMMMNDGCGVMMGRMNMNPNMMGTNNAAVCPWDAAEFSAWQKGNGISTPLNKSAAKRWAEYYVAAYNNPDLTVGKITEKNNGYEVEVRSKKDKKVLEKILVDKSNGWISRVQ